ncbi:MAG: aminoglycoside phosphotransferase family protein [Colwellia sp.]|nr:aminoglycoside phosphotransferase family protein [Colwellia sp.]
MMKFDNRHNLKNLLNLHSVSLSGWAEMNHGGFSGARIYKQSNQDGMSYILKVTSAQTDWIMRTTSDRMCREAVLANTSIRQERVISPAIGSAQDGPIFSILMHDISDQLLPNEGLSKEQLNTILLGMSDLHSLVPPDLPDIPWCTIEDRLTLFEPNPAKLAQFSNENDILAGWEVFFKLAPKDIKELARSLFNDLGPLRRALSRLPNSFLHGDLKTDNIGISPNGTMTLIDWSMPMIAPAAVDLGWFLAVNSRALPMTLDETIKAYSDYSNIEDHLSECHQSLTVLCGFLLRGWRKALDAQSGDPSEFRWWCERASSASKILSC